MSESVSAVRATESRASLSLASRMVIYTLLSAGALLAFYAHIRIAPVSDDYTGSLVLLDRVFDIAFALVLVGLSFCAGRGIARRLGLGFVSLAEEICFSVILGVGTIGSLVALLALIGALKPVAVAGLFLLLIAISHREAARLRSVLGEGFRAVTQNRTRRILAVMFILLAAILVLRTAAPPHNYDEAIYHLSVSKSFVERGRIYPVYDNCSGNLPFLLHMFYAVCLIAKTDIAAKMFSLCLAGISSLALYAFCVRFLDRRAGTIALFGFFGTGMVVEVATTARIDVSLAGILFLAAYAMMIYLERREPSWLWASAALAGFGISIKYTAGIWLGLLLLMFLFETMFRGRHSVRDITKHLVAYMFIAGMIAAPWYIKNLVWFHNPVYPFLTGEVSNLSPGEVRFFNDEDEHKLAAHFDEARAAMPDAVKAQEMDLELAASRHVPRHPLRVWEYFTSPSNFNVAEPYHDPNYLFLLSPLFLLFTTRKWLVWLSLFGASFYLFVAATAWSGRYLLPIYPGLTILAAYTMNELTVRLRRLAPLIIVLPAIAVGVAVSASLIVCISQIQAMDGFRYLRGAISRRQFMFGMFYYPSIDFLNNNLEPNDRVLMIGAQMCYDMKRDYVVDMTRDSTVWRRFLLRNSTLDGVNRDLKQQGITHILYTPNEYVFSAMIGREDQMDYRTGGGPAYIVEQRNWATFERYRRAFLEPIYADKSGYYIYAIK